MFDMNTSEKAIVDMAIQQGAVIAAIGELLVEKGIATEEEIVSRIPRIQAAIDQQVQSQVAKARQEAVEELREKHPTMASVFEKMLEEAL